MISRSFSKAAPRGAAFFFLLVFALSLFADEKAVTEARAASDARPQHPTLLYRLAAALDANGQREEAARVLERIATMGFVYPVEKDFPHQRYASVAKRFALNAKAVGNPRHERTIERLGLIAEGMAWDGRRLFVSSVATKAIFADGQEFATAPWSVFGMCADPKRGVLWAATSAMFDEANQGKAALLRIDLKSGRILETIAAPAGEHHFGDVTVAPDGEVYVSDSKSPNIYRLEGSALAPFVTGSFRSLQGLAVRGNTLYLADYSLGLFAIDRRTRDVHALRVPPTISLLGIDGLYSVDETTLVATQNGTTPNRILRITLAPGGLSVLGAQTLLANHPLMADPTLGVVANGRFFFNANAQWDLFGEDGKISDPLRLSEAVVLSVPLR